MDEQFFEAILTEKGVISGLFVLIVVSIIYAIRIGVPYVFRYVRNLAESYQDQLKEQNSFYKENLDTITAQFLQNMAEHQIWHGRHNEQLKDIRSDLHAVRTVLTK